MKKNKCYLASELGFSELGQLVLKLYLIPFLETELQVKVINPFDEIPQQYINNANSLFPGLEKDNANDELLKIIKKIDKELLYESDFVIAILDGMIQDVGVVCEIKDCGLNQRPVIAYRGDFRIATENYRAPFNAMLVQALEESIGSKNGFLYATTLEQVKKIYFEKVYPMLQGGGDIKRISSVLKDASSQLKNDGKQFEERGANEPLFFYFASLFFHLCFSMYSM